MLVVLSLYEPFSEIALNSYVHHLFLLTGQVFALDQFLNVSKAGHAHIHYIYIRVLGT